MLDHDEQPMGCITHCSKRQALMQRVLAPRAHKDLDNPFRAAIGGAWHITITENEVGHSGSSQVTSKGVTKRVCWLIQTD